MRLGMSGRRRRFTLFPLIAVCAAAAVIFVGVRIQTALVSTAHAYANNVATTSISNSVYEVFSQLDGGDYSEILSQERATLFSTDTARINLINSRLAERIQAEVLAGGYETVGIPLGSVSGIAAFSGIGPEIPVKIHPISLVNTDFDESFESCGINQVRHSMSLNVEIVMAYSGYLFSETETVTVSVPVIDTVIVGETPEFYGGGEIFAGEEVVNEGYRKTN